MNVTEQVQVRVGWQKKEAVRNVVPFINDEHPVALLLDFTRLRQTIRELKEAFPPHFLHAFAIKANGLRWVLEVIRDSGLGCETASPGELAQALRCGFSPSKVVFDSPAKTRKEIKEALEAGVSINLDNFQELQRVSDVVQTITLKENQLIGIRVNPQVGAGTISAMSTATKTSKFGIPLEDDGNTEKVLCAYQKYPWLNCVHLHVGSQGCPLELISKGIERVIELVEEINKRSNRKQISTIDIGGGLPVNFDGEEIKPTYAEYCAFLKSRVPRLFDTSLFTTVITEFGRSVVAKTGMIVTRVEYTKVSGGRHIALVQAGADLFVRTVYMPDKWAIRLSAFDAHGNHKEGNEVEQDVCGPCCFAGDIIAHQRRLPLLQPDDFVVAHDTGAYYLSAFSAYNTRLLPAVYGYDYESEEEGVTLSLLKPGSTIEQTLQFFCN